MLLKTFIIIEAVNVIPIGLAKCSLLFFYLRVFRGKLFSVITWATITLAAMWAISFFFSLLFACTPIHLYVREGITTPDVSCINTTQVYYAVSISDFVIDVVILVIPVPFIWRLHMKPAQKVAVTGIFALGSLYMKSSQSRSRLYANAIPGPSQQASCEWWSSFNVHTLMKQRKKM